MLTECSSLVAVQIVAVGCPSIHPADLRRESVSVLRCCWWRRGMAVCSSWCSRGWIDRPSARPSCWRPVLCLRCASGWTDRLPVGIRSIVASSTAEGLLVAGTDGAVIWCDIPSAQATARARQTRATGCVTGDRAWGGGIIWGSGGAWVAIW